MERMVKKRFDSKDVLIMLGLLAAIFILVGLSIFFLIGVLGQVMLAFLVIAGVVYGGFRLLTMRNLEFEYSFTNGYVSVDKIINRNSRKRLTAFECKEVEEIGAYEKNKTRLQNRELQSRIFASQYADGRDAWYVIVNAKKTGRTLLVFDPDEALLQAVKQAIPSHLRFEVFGRNG